MLQREKISFQTNLTQIYRERGIYKKKMTTNCYCNYLKVGDAYLQLIIIVVMVIVIVIIMMRRIGLIT